MAEHPIKWLLICAFFFFTACRLFLWLVSSAVMGLSLDVRGKVGQHWTAVPSISSAAPATANVWRVEPSAEEFNSTTTAPSVSEGQNYSLTTWGPQCHKSCCCFFIFFFTGRIRVHEINIQSVMHKTAYVQWAFLCFSSINNNIWPVTHGIFGSLILPLPLTPISLQSDAKNWQKLKPFLA